MDERLVDSNDAHARAWVDASAGEITVPSHEIAQGVAQRQDDSKGWNGQLVDFAYFLNTASRLAGFTVRSLAQRSPTS